MSSTRFRITIEGTGLGPNPTAVQNFAAIIHNRPGVEVTAVKFTAGSPMNPQDQSPSLDDVFAATARIREMEADVRAAVASRNIDEPGAVGTIGGVNVPTVTNTDPVDEEPTED